MFAITTIGNVDNQAIGRARNYASYIDSLITIPEFKVDKCIVDSRNVNLIFKDGESVFVSHATVAYYADKGIGGNN